jgi:excisionase family DNA binding protein
MVTTLHSPSEQVFASQEEVDQARAFAPTLTQDARLSVESHGDPSVIPPELSHILGRIVRVLAEGGTVTVGSMPKKLTTTAAAEMLDISRPTLMKMIERGEIEAHRVGSHTRLHTADVVAARQSRADRQMQSLNELRQMERELGL